MSEVDEIKKVIEASWPKVPAAQLCGRLIDFVTGLPEPETRLMTIPMLAGGVGSGVDEDFLAALTILVSSSVEMLQPRALLIDDDNNEYEIDASELASARADGGLIHPETGKRVQDFECKLFPFFVPSARFLTMMQGEHGR